MRYQFLGKTLFFPERKILVVGDLHIGYDYMIQQSGVLLPEQQTEEIISELKRNYNGLIISDEIHMLGLKNYFNSLDEMYVAVFKAGNDLILNFDKDPNEIYRMIQIVKEAVEKGEIPEEHIDASVTKILQAKGFMVTS